MPVVRFCRLKASGLVVIWPKGNREYSALPVPSRLGMIRFGKDNASAERNLLT
jgi:hypothetical protein